MFKFITAAAFVRVSQAADDSTEDLYVDPDHFDKAWSPPGMQIRLEQRTINEFKKAMFNFLPHFVEADLHLPDTHEAEIGILFDIIKFHFLWTDIKYTKPALDIHATNLEIRKENDSGWTSLAIDIPLIKHWSIEAHEQLTNWFGVDNSEVYIELQDVKFDLVTSLYVGRDGMLTPSVRDLSIDLGDSKVSHNRILTSIIANEFIPLAFSVIENGLTFFGDWILGNMLAPVLDNALGHYRYKFRMDHFLPGQNVTDIFEFDFRNTYSPSIYDGYADFYIAGDLWYRNEGCNLTNDQLEFVENIRRADGNSQIVISESAAKCWANQIA